MAHGSERFLKRKKKNQYSSDTILLSKYNSKSSPSSVIKLLFETFKI
jgi:hypothetical protein